MTSRIDQSFSFHSLSPGIFLLVIFSIIVVVLWSFYWKGRALWRAAKNDSRKWFVALLVVNTFGILEILYLYVWGKEKEAPPTTDQLS